MSLAQPRISALCPFLGVVQKPPKGKHAAAGASMTSPCCPEVPFRQPRRRPRGTEPCIHTISKVNGVLGVTPMSWSSSSLSWDKKTRAADPHTPGPEWFTSQGQEEMHSREIV